LAVEPIKLRVLPARLSDLDQIMEIELLSFSSPWSRQVFLEEFERDFAHLKVLRASRGRVVAFINYWVVADEIHVLNVATHPDWRRRGLGRRLMLHCLREARKRESALVTLEVRRSNEKAINLYQSLGFEPVGVRPRYYENKEDAIVMVLRLDG
jgi:[ribosomal protein S18]-alanine N-acetyltransferase